MAEIEEISRRLDALETRIAHQDRAMEDLNGAVIAQWKEIERLAQLVAKLSDRIFDLENTEQSGELPDPPPPHY